LKFAADRLVDGEWINIFPEGRIVARDGDILPIRPGVAKILLETTKSPERNAAIVLPDSSTDETTDGVPLPPTSSARAKTPIVLPIFSYGMASVKPLGTKIPTIGNRVRRLNYNTNGSMRRVNTRLVCLIDLVWFGLDWM